MRTLARISVWPCLSTLLCTSGCGAYTEFFPFQAVPTTGQQPAEVPAGIRWATELRGLVTVPNRGIAKRQFELTIEIEQPGTAESPLWEPIELERTKLLDDEGHAFAAAAVMVADDPKSKRGKLVAIERRHYLVIFDVVQAYRFESIGRATVSWRLRAAGHRPITIKSTFKSAFLH